MPIKAFKDAKLRLADVLSPGQRAHLSYLMLDDILTTLSTSGDVEGVTLVSSDISVATLARQYQVDFFSTLIDGGYSHDALEAITSRQEENVDIMAIIPSDVPYLSHADLSHLNLGHEEGMTLCPAIMDGGTNALIFSPPLRVPLMFGVDSLRKYQSEAQRCDVPVKIEQIPGLQLDIDRPADLRWLREQPSGGQAWSYIRDIEISEQ